MEIRYEKWIKEETRLDSRASSRTQDPRAEEDARGENRQVSEAHRRRDATKGIRIIARLARLITQKFRFSYVANKPRHSRARGCTLRVVLLPNQLRFITLAAALHCDR
jgi:hypothetical protein